MSIGFPPPLLGVNLTTPNDVVVVATAGTVGQTNSPTLTGISASTVNVLNQAGSATQWKFDSDPNSSQGRISNNNLANTFEIRNTAVGNGSQASFTFVDNSSNNSGNGAERMAMGYQNQGLGVFAERNYIESSNDPQGSTTNAPTPFAFIQTGFLNSSYGSHLRYLFDSDGSYKLYDIAGNQQITLPPLSSGGTLSFGGTTVASINVNSATGGYIGNAAGNTILGFNTGNTGASGGTHVQLTATASTNAEIYTNGSELDLYSGASPGLVKIGLNGDVIDIGIGSNAITMGGTTIASFNLNSATGGYIGNAAGNTILGFNTGNTSATGGTHLQFTATASTNAEIYTNGSELDLYSGASPGLVKIGLNGDVIDIGIGSNAITMGGTTIASLNLNSGTGGYIANAAGNPMVAFNTGNSGASGGTHLQLTAGGGVSAAIYTNGSELDVYSGAASNGVVKIGLNTDKIYMTTLPTSDPHSVGELWNNSGVMTISAG